MKYCLPVNFGIKAICCQYPVIIDRKLYKGNLPLKIVSIVCFHLEVSEDEIFSKSHKWANADARSVAMTLIYKNCDMSKSAIGKFFKRDHSTVIFALNKCQEMLATDKKFTKTYEVIKERVYNYITNNER